MKTTKIAIPGLLLLLLVNAGCQKEEKFDINGKWSFCTGSVEVAVFSFSGAVEKGTLVVPDHEEAGTGNYSVSKKEVVFDFTSQLTGGGSLHFRGSFVSENQLSGSMDMVTPYPPMNGHWKWKAGGFSCA